MKILQRSGNEKLIFYKILILFKVFPHVEDVYSEAKTIYLTHFQEGKHRPHAQHGLNYGYTWM